MDLSKNQDFKSISEKSEKPQGGRPATDHAVSIPENLNEV
jgi:hypothetical protein